MIRVRGHDHKSYTLYHIKFYCSKATLRGRLERLYPLICHCGAASV